MVEEYLLDFKIRDKTNEQKEKELLMSIIKVKKELDDANKNFQFADGDLIDYYTYQIKANRSKFDYLIKQAKLQGLQTSIIKQIELNLNEAI